MTANAGQKFIAAAIVLGLAAAVVGYYSLTALAASTTAGSKAKMRDVVVTASDLTFGVKLEPTLLRVVRYPRESIPEGAFSSIDSVVGQTTKVFMSAREPVTTLKLSSRGGGLSMLVRPNMRAASVEVNQVSGVSGFVLPGDRVDVLVTVEQLGAVSTAVTRTVLQSVEVLAAGQKTQQQDNKPMSVQSVTLLVEPQGAEILAHAQHEGEIHLVLRNPEDQQEVPVASFSTSQMMGRAEPARHWTPGATSPARRAELGTVRMIRSGSVSETPAVPDSINR